MKKMVMIVAMMLLGLTSVFAAAGNAKVEIASIFTMSAGSFPTDGTPQVIVANTAISDFAVVSGLEVNDNSLLGWNITVDGGGVLDHATNGTTIAYTLEMAYVSGDLGTDLTLAPALGTALTLGADAIQATGASATTATEAYTFNILMNIAAAASENKTVGVYTEALTLTLVAD